MRAMKMAKLDFLTMRSSLLVFGLALIWVMFFLRAASLFTWFFTGAWYVAIYSTTIFGTEEKDGLRRLYGMLALRVKDIVLGRYLHMLLSFLAVLAVFAVIISIPQVRLVLRMESSGGPSSLLAFGAAFLAFAVIVSFQVPFFFKLGYTRARFIAMLPFGLGVLPFFLTKLPGLQLEFGKMLSLAVGHPLLSAWLALACGVLLLLISTRVSVALYQPKR